jgi:hypothetical protein
MGVGSRTHDVRLVGENSWLETFVSQELQCEASGHPEGPTFVSSRLHRPYLIVG